MWNNIDKVPEFKRKRRDIYGELGWNSNCFNTPSKFNQAKYKSRRDYFDQPKNNDTLYKIAKINNQDFFRSVAPKKSIAHSKNKDKTSLVHRSLHVHHHESHIERTDETGIKLSKEYTLSPR